MESPLYFITNTKNLYKSAFFLTKKVVDIQIGGLEQIPYSQGGNY